LSAAKVLASTGIFNIYDARLGAREVPRASARYQTFRFKDEIVGGGGAAREGGRGREREREREIVLSARIADTKASRG